jgi:hypothetical protein
MRTNQVGTSPRTTVKANRDGRFSRPTNFVAADVSRRTFSRSPRRSAPTDVGGYCSGFQGRTISGRFPPR